MKSLILIFILGISSFCRAVETKNPPEKIVDWVESVEASEENFYISLHSQARLFKIEKKDPGSEQTVKKLQQAVVDKQPLGFAVDPVTQKILEVISP